MSTDAPGSWRTVTLCTSGMGVARTRFFPAAASDRDRGHGREELRTLEAVTLTAWLAYPHRLCGSPCGYGRCPAG